MDYDYPSNNFVLFTYWLYIRAVCICVVVLIATELKRISEGTKIIKSLAYNKLDDNIKQLPLSGVSFTVIYLLFGKKKLPLVLYRLYLREIDNCTIQVADIFAFRLKNSGVVGDDNVADRRIFAISPRR